MRRFAALAAAGTLVLSGAASVAVAAAASSTTASWRQTDGSASESRANLEESTLTPATVANASLRLSEAQTTSSPDCSDYSPKTPLLSASHLFVTAGGYIKEYDANSGRLSQQIKLFFPTTTTYAHLLLGQGAVIAGGNDCTSASDPNGEVEAFNSTTGTPLWLHSGPAIHDMVESGAFIVVSGGTFASGNYVDALNIADGTQAWSTLPDCLQGQTPVAGGIVVYSGCEATSTGDGVAELVGRRLATGRQVWSRRGTFLVYRADSDTDAHAKVYVANRHGNPVAINPQTGATLYHLNGGDVVTAVDDKRVYATCGQHTRFCAYDKRTGTRVWRVNYTAGGGTGPLAVIGDDVVYLDDGRMLNAANGTLLGQLWSTGRASSLAIGRGHVAAVTDGVHVDLYGLAN